MYYAVAHAHDYTPRNTWVIAMQRWCEFVFLPDCRSHPRLDWIGAVGFRIPRPNPPVITPKEFAGNGMCRWQGSAIADSRGQCPSPVGIRWRPVLLAVESLRPHRPRIASRRIGRSGLRVLRSQLHSQDVAVALAATRYESCRGIAPCHRLDTKVEHQHPATRSGFWT